MSPSVVFSAALVSFIKKRSLFIKRLRPFGFRVVSRKALNHHKNFFILSEKSVPFQAMHLIFGSLYERVLYWVATCWNNEKVEVDGVEKNWMLK